MTPQIAVLIEKIRHLESELDAELAKSRAELRIGKFRLNFFASPLDRGQVNAG